VPADGRSWLLIKHRHEWSSPEHDNLQFEPLTVASGGDNADILSEYDPDNSRSNRPAQGGETGALFERIVAQAMSMKAGAARPTARKAARKKR
jgi:hypothetical protein